MGLGLDVDIFPYLLSICDQRRLMHNCTSRAFAICKHLDCRLLSYSITHFFTEISPNETPHNGASGMGMHCLSMSYKVITQTNCFIPFKHAQWEWKIGKKLIKHMKNETIQPPETNAQYLGWGPSLLGAEFVRGRVWQGPRCPGIDCPVHN